MDEKQIFSVIETIFFDVFDDNTLVITRDTSAADIDEWDSLEQINLLTAMEKKFNLKFTLSDVRNLKNVGDLADLIKRLIGA